MNHHISLNTLVKRINRRVAADGAKLKLPRGKRGRAELGEYYTIDVNRNFISAKHVDPEEMGRQLGVLHPWERVQAK